MDDQNTNNQNQQQKVNLPPAAAPVQQSATNLKQGLEKVKNLPVWRKVFSRFETFPPRERRLLKIAAAIFIFAFIMLILASIVKSLRFVKPVSTPIPTPSSKIPLPTPQGIGTPSVYATDSGVLKIEGDIKVLENKLENTDLEETNLRSPDINFYVNFTQ